MPWFLFFLITIVFLESTIFGWFGGLLGLWATVGFVFTSAVIGIIIIIVMIILFRKGDYLTNVIMIFVPTILYALHTRLNI